MIKQTKAYRSALAQLADAIAEQDPAEVMLLGLDVLPDLHDVLERRHPKFYAAIDVAYEEAVQQLKQTRKQAGIEKRRATMRKRPTEKAV